MAAIYRVDDIVIGGGASGCVVAARLAHAGRRVLLLEAGGAGRSPLISTPGLSGFASSSVNLHWGYETEPQSELGGRRFGLTAARVLGGGSAINGMVYTRGFPQDYDRWRDHGCTGWGFADVLPYFKRSEDSERGANTWHATGGPLAVSKGQSSPQISQRIVEAAWEAGFAQVDDFASNAFDGFGFYDFTIAKGLRASSSAAFLRGAKGPGPSVLVNATVRRLLVEHGKVRGVELSVGGQPAMAWAEGEVILCAGAVNTPKLLLNSGIGDADDLGRLGIPVVLDQPQVGRNFQNHLCAKVAVSITRPLSAYRYLHPLHGARELGRYALHRTGFLAEGIAPAGGFFRSDDALATPDLQLFAPPLLTGMGKGTGYRALLPPEHGYSLFVSHSTPASRGRISLRSADPGAPPVIQANYLSEPGDLEALVSAVERMRDIASRPALSAITKAEVRPGNAAATRKDIAAYLRETASNQHHPAGTCRMGASPEQAVVDPALRVFGIEGLRIADASVMPDLINGNTNAPVMMIAERAADFILADSR